MLCGQLFVTGVKSVFQAGKSPRGRRIAFSSATEALERVAFGHLGEVNFSACVQITNKVVGSKTQIRNRPLFLHGPIALVPIQSSPINSVVLVFTPPSCPANRVKTFNPNVNTIVHLHSKKNDPGYFTLSKLGDAKLASKRHFQLLRN